MWHAIAAEHYAKIYPADFSLYADTDFEKWRASYGMFIHSGYCYSASSNPLLLRGTPDTARTLCWSYTPMRHRQLRVKDLPKIPTWRLERDLNPQPFGWKAANLPMSHHAPWHVIKILSTKSRSSFSRMEHLYTRYTEGSRWSSGINAANGACGLRFASRILHTVQQTWTSR